MSAEEIATVVADLRAGRVMSVVRDETLDKFGKSMIGAAAGAPVVDATAIYKSLVDRDTGVAFYEDHNIAPVWRESLICYVNEHGNVIVHVVLAFEFQGGMRWEGANDECDWERVKWVFESMTFAGGTAATGSQVPTSGPLLRLQLAVYEDGEIGDIHWIQVYEAQPVSVWDMATLVLLGTLTFFVSRNVELGEPVSRPRGIRRRMDRIGVKVNELLVFPVGKSTRSLRTGDIVEGSQPISNVRGHYAKYGIEGRGLLFGKYAGRFWIPEHARGAEEVGTVEHRYRIVLPDVATDERVGT